MSDSQVIADSAKPSEGARPSESEPLPRPFGRFELRSLLGRAKTGHVYLAHDPQAGQLLILRIPQPSRSSGADWKARFLNASRHAKKILHPGICPILEVGDWDGQPYLTTPVIEGATLDERLSRRGALTIEESVQWIRSIASALSEIHEHGMVHGDLRPSNIMIDRHGQPIVLDFGHAVRPDDPRDGRKAYAHLGLGVSEYLAPEQAGSQIYSITPAFDVYSLGVLLFKLTTGRLPFTASSFGRLIAQIERDPPPRPSSLNPKIDGLLEGIILKSLQKLPAQRYASATRFIEALHAWRPAPIDDFDSAPPPSLATPTPSAGRSTFTPIPAAALLGSGLIGFIAGALLVFALLRAPANQAKPPASAADPQRSTKADREPSPPPAAARPLDSASAPASDLFRSPVGNSARHATRNSAQPEPTATPVAPPIVAPREATIIEIPGWTMLTDASQTETERWLAEQKEHSRSVIWLDAVGINQKPIFSAIAARDDRQTDWTALLDVSQEEMNDVKVLARRIDPNQHLVSSLSGYHRNERVFCSVLFQAGRKPGCVIGVTPRYGIEKQLTEMADRGLSPKLLRPIDIEGKNLFCAVYCEPSSNPNLRYGLTVNESALNRMLDDYQAQGLEPVCIAPLELKDHLKFTCTFHEAPLHAKWEHHRDLSSSDLKTKATALAAIGLRPSSIVGYACQGALRYSTIWVKDATSE